jgi:hypothetical protein
MSSRGRRKRRPFVNISPSTTPAPAHCLKMREPLTLGTRPFLFHLLFLDLDFIVLHISYFLDYKESEESTSSPGDGHMEV